MGPLTGPACVLAGAGRRGGDRSASRTRITASIISRVIRAARETLRPKPFHIESFIIVASDKRHRGRRRAKQGPLRDAF